MTAELTAPNNSMYLVLPVPFRILDGKLHVEAQAANGLDRWADNFSEVIVAAPAIPEREASKLAGFVWRKIDTLEHIQRIMCQPLPWAYSPLVFFKQARATRKLMAASIARSRHLQFAIGGLFGDWAAVAAMEAIRQKRRYAVHTDRVEHEVLRKTSGDAVGLRRLKVAAEVPLMERYHRYIIKRCSLGLWHGDDCYRAYSPWCAQSHLIHDVHTKQSDLIDKASLDRKLEDVRTSKVLQLCYAGRLDPMKAPLEWLRAIAAARDMGVRLQATWYGEGPLRDEAKAEAKRLNLDGIVSYPGFIAGRAELLNHVRSAYAMVFTHVTPESPRNLLEALVSGTPILGYDNAYAANLVEVRGGGALVPKHDFRALGAVIAEMANNREKLAELIRQAAANGQRFSDGAVFAERSQLLKQYV